MLLLAGSVKADKAPVEGLLMHEFGDAFSENFAIQRFYLQTKDE